MAVRRGRRAWCVAPVSPWDCMAACHTMGHTGARRRRGAPAEFSLYLLGRTAVQGGGEVARVATARQSLDCLAGRYVWGLVHTGLPPRQEAGGSAVFGIWVARDLTKLGFVKNESPDPTSSWEATRRHAFPYTRKGEESRQACVSSAWLERRRRASQLELTFP